MLCGFKWVGLDVLLGEFIDKFITVCLEFPLFQFFMMIEHTLLRFYLFLDEIWLHPIHLG